MTRPLSLEDAKAALLDRAAAVAGEAVLAAGVRPEALLANYYRHVAPEDLLGRDPVDVLGAATSHLHLASVRPPGRPAVRVFTPTIDEHGWASGHTVVEIITDDMPFLVDSVTAELSREERAIHRVVHPQIVVRRSLTGELVELVGSDPAAPRSPDAIVEAWIAVEIDRESDAADRDAVAASVLRVLRDVREAVEDWRKMRDRAVDLAAELEAHPPKGLPAADVEEAVALLRWLADDSFTFLGYRDYRLDVDDGNDVLRAVPATGLGILRWDQVVSQSFSVLPPEVQAKAREKSLLILTKANSRATVHRPAYLDYVAVKQFDDDGEVVGEHRFLGLYTANAYTRSVKTIPVLRRTAEAVMAASGFTPNSHSAKDLEQLLETYPRDELFQTTAEELTPIALSIVHLQERRQVKLYLRRDSYGRFMSCLVYLPRDRYTTVVRERMMQILKDAFGAATVEYSALVSESVLARLHFVVRMPPGRLLPEVDAEEIEERLAASTREWVDDFARAAVDQLGEEDAASAVRRYGGAFPPAYRADFPARTAVSDLRHLEETPEGVPTLNLYEPLAARPGERRLKLYRVGSPVSLSEVLPHLQRMGVEVVDERPYRVDRRDAPPGWIYDFGLRWGGGQPAGGIKTLFQEAFGAVWSGRADSDGFNALLLAGLHWRQVVVLRAYARYLRQGGLPFSREYVEAALTSNVEIARLLVELFETRHDPARPDDGRAELANGLVTRIEHALDGVASLDQDRILRALLGAIVATLRTNYYQRDADGSPKPYLSLKLDSAQVPELPAPRPMFEIWVHSPTVEGVHLRFGHVARGGLRWSDRREDFRTEILGLVKAQTVKNAVIVPTGAKGGFVVRSPQADPTDREAVTAEGVACYRQFICGLLDVTDNLVAGHPVAPPDVVRHDAPDAYLVVAADKGTAAFSDIANAVALDYGFWLGDAFASGGSAGYDHKAMGITARGAWESVTRHFRELGISVANEDITAIGIGDMSGDVFGNGMLLSEHLRLVAAFDHRHVFLDPDPDAAGSYAERRRLLALPRSSWEDYDRAVISPGGGVYPRTAKSVPISPQVAERLALPQGTSALTPNALIRAILTAPVDLFWNGGIGTYVKASSETNAQVGDKANDAIRVNGREVRARVVGEGGNLGFTQLGRVEYALQGGQINTDAIDNSAGVDTSDHEVNIKILLDAAVADGDLTAKQRNEVLAAMTDDVASLVLEDNYEQNLELAMLRARFRPLLNVHRRLVADLERTGDLDRALEFLPTDAQLDQRAADGVGLTSPEVAVLLAYVKNGLTAHLAGGEPGQDLASEPWTRRTLCDYFPRLLRERFADRMPRHPLRREIVLTSLVNGMVNRGGLTFAFRATEETGAALTEVVRAYAVVREVFALDAYWTAIRALDDVAPTHAQNLLYLEGRRLLDRGTRWFLQSRRSQLDVTAEVDRFAAPIASIAPLMPQLLLGSERERLLRRSAEFVKLGAPEPIALQAAALLDVFSLLDVTEISVARSRPVEEVARLYFALSERMQVDSMLLRITALPREDRWQALARSSLRSDLYAALAGLTVDVLTATTDLPDAEPAVRIDTWGAANAEGLARARSTLDEVLSADISDLATLSVALRVVRTLLRSGGAA